MRTGKSERRENVRTPMFVSTSPGPRLLVSPSPRFLDPSIPRSMPTPLTDKTKGQIEASITEALTKFEREYLGRGPREAQSFLLGDLVVVRLKGILSPAERQLSNEPDGVEMIKQMRAPRRELQRRHRSAHRGGDGRRRRVDAHRHQRPDRRAGLPLHDPGSAFQVPRFGFRGLDSRRLS